MMTLLKPDDPIHLEEWLFRYAVDDDLNEAGRPHSFGRVIISLCSCWWSYVKPDDPINLEEWLFHCKLSRAICTNCMIPCYMHKPYFPVLYAQTVWLRAICTNCMIPCYMHKPYDSVLSAQTVYSRAICANYTSVEDPCSRWVSVIRWFDLHGWHGAIVEALCDVSTSIFVFILPSSYSSIAPLLFVCTGTLSCPSSVEDHAVDE